VENKGLNLKWIQAERSNRSVASLPSFGMPDCKLEDRAASWLAHLAFHLERALWKEAQDSGSLSGVNSSMGWVKKWGV
jgi:hypothetical protein